jgi:hypothetical protein
MFFRAVSRGRTGPSCPVLRCWVAIPVAICPTRVARLGSDLHGQRASGLARQRGPIGGASSWRTPPSRPRASRHSRVSECGPRGSRRAVVGRPAMAAKVTERLWEMGDIVDMLEAWEASNGRTFRGTRA